MSKTADKLGDLTPESSQNDAAVDMVLEEPMYYVLGQFLETGDDDNRKNIAQLLQELVLELKQLNTTIKDFKPSSQ